MIPKFYINCVGCDRSFVKVNLETGEEKSFASQYPVCMGCMQKGTADKRFWEQVKQKIHVISHNINKS